MRILVGCCGLPMSLEKYSKIFDCVEINRTFYKLPKPETGKKWKEKVPEGFIFCVKCFQGVTHPASSPTWRRYGKIEGNKENYGNFQPTKEVFESWEKTLEFCRSLEAKVCVIQAPKRFKDTPLNLKNVINFFKKIKKDGLEIGVELRGWEEKNIKKVCEKFRLIDVVDPFVRMPCVKRKIVYFRLHGSPPGKKMYSYKYTTKDFAFLKEKIDSLSGVKEVFCLFNNIYMKDDGIKFKKFLEKLDL